MPGQAKHSRIPFRYLEEDRFFCKDYFLYAVDRQIGEMAHGLEVIRDTGTQDVQCIAHADYTPGRKAVLPGIRMTGSLVANQADTLFINCPDKRIQMVHVGRVVDAPLAIEDTLRALKLLPLGIGCVCHKHRKIEDAFIDTLPDLLGKIWCSQIPAYGEVAQFLKVQAQAASGNRPDLIPAPVPLNAGNETDANDTLDFADQPDNSLLGAVEPFTQVCLVMPAAIQHEPLEKPEQLVAAAGFILFQHDRPPRPDVWPAATEA